MFRLIAQWSTVTWGQVGILPLPVLSLLRVLLYERVLRDNDVDDMGSGVELMEYILNWLCCWCYGDERKACHVIDGPN